MDRHDSKYMLAADVSVVPVLEGRASLEAVWVGVDTPEVPLRCRGHRTHHIRDVRLNLVAGSFLFDPT